MITKINFKNFKKVRNIKMFIKKEQVEQAMLKFQIDLLQTSTEQYHELKNLQKEIKQLSEIDDTQRKTIKELRTILKRIIKYINYIKEPILIRFINELIKEYGTFFLGLGD